MEGKEFLRSYQHCLDEIFNSEFSNHIYVYQQLSQVKHWDIAEEAYKFNSEEEVMEYMRSLIHDKIKEVEALKPVSEDLKAEVINGMVEVSDGKGNYLRRICNDAASAEINGFDLVVVKKNGDVELYGDYGNYIRTLASNATRAKFTERGVLIVKQTGEEIIADVDGFCIKVNR